jgi:hypothetical protein
MPSMSNLNKFEDSYQVLEKNPKLCLLRKNKSKDSYNECLNKKIWHNFFTKNTIGTNVHEMYECNKNQVLYYNVKSFKK